MIAGVFEQRSVMTSATCGAASSRLQFEIFERGRERPARDESESRLLDTRTNTTEKGHLKDWRKHGTVVDELLHAMQQHLTLPSGRAPLPAQRASRSG